jgi:type II secretory pathway pseudopilin PulG
MRTRSKQSGLTLPEMAVVIATIALLVGFALPAIRALVNSFETQSGAKTMISAALASGRAIAAREQRYAGVRFQQDSAGNQYMIFIMHEEPGKMGNLTIGFKAVEGVKPIKLPETAIVTDLRYNPDLLSPAGDSFIDSDVEIANANVFRDSTSFSVIFSPSGRLVLHDVRVRNRDGRTEGTETPTMSRDDVFNTLTKITDPVDPVGRFIQDDYPAMGLSAESSRNSFVIVYEKKKFQQAREMGVGWSDYLKQTAPDRIYINAYTGTIILPD